MSGAFIWAALCLGGVYRASWHGGCGVGIDLIAGSLFCLGFGAFFGGILLVALLQAGIDENDAAQNQPSDSPSDG